MASYQLRSPSSAIMSALSFWKEGLVDKLPPAEKNQFIDNLYKRSQQLGQVIRDVLQASEFDTEKISFADKHLSVLDVAGVVEKIKSNFVEVARAKGLQLIIKNEAKITTIKSFADYLSEAISNLVDNAIRYTKIGQVEIHLSNESKMLVIEVTDTGLGIPVADQARIFSRFVHGANVGALSADGSGLGLFLTKEIIEAHKGGQISFHSQEGQGTTFKIKLPLAK
ncbi:MAG: HAMP domain-containing sensor histidine kinase [Patescibacteria group bacterium]